MATDTMTACVTCGSEDIYDTATGKCYPCWVDTEPDNFFREVDEHRQWLANEQATFYLSADWQQFEAEYRQELFESRNPRSL